MGPAPRPLLDRFNEKFTPEPNSGCWLWTAGTNRHGYGKVSLGNKVVVTANRAAWLVFRGPIPDGMWVCHKCDVPACVNPDHLFLGTPLDNSRDMVRKGRDPRGERQGRTRLTDADAAAILASQETNGALKRRFNVSHTVIHRIKTGKSWRFLPASPAAAA